LIQTIIHTGKNRDTMLFCHVIIMLLPRGYHIVSKLTCCFYAVTGELCIIQVLKHVLRQDDGPVRHPFDVKMCKQFIRGKLFGLLDLTV